MGTGPAPGVLFIHGYRGDQLGYRERADATSVGGACLTFDLRGHGRSGGDVARLSIKDHLADGVAAYDELAAQRRVDRAGSMANGRRADNQLGRFVGFRDPGREGR